METSKIVVLDCWEKNKNNRNKSLLDNFTNISKVSNILEMSEMKQLLEIEEKKSSKKSNIKKNDASIHTLNMPSHFPRQPETGYIDLTWKNIINLSEKNYYINEFRMELENEVADDYIVILTFEISNQVSVIIHEHSPKDCEDLDEKFLSIVKEYNNGIFYTGKDMEIYLHNLYLWYDGRLKWQSALWVKYHNNATIYNYPSNKNL